MVEWRRGPILAVGGLVAVAFDGDDAIAVGSHSGLGVFDTGTGALLERRSDIAGTADWYHADPPAIRRTGPRGIRLLPAAGLWGGRLPDRTRDGWVASADARGVTVTRAGDVAFRCGDADEVRAFGFSPGDTRFVVATAATLYLFGR